MHKFTQKFVMLMMTLTLCSCDDANTNRTVTDRQLAITDANKVCTAMRATGVPTRCFVDENTRTINVAMYTNGEEARKICVGASAGVADKTHRLKGQWRLRILSPDSVNRPIAECDF